jgi:hypothetical protein
MAGSEESRMTTALQIHTARLTYGGDDRLDVTRQFAERERRVGRVSPGEAFAPPRWLLNVAKGFSQRLPRGVVAPPDDEVGAELWYFERYREAMRETYRTQRGQWDALLARETVTLVCFCESAEHCHRGVLAAILVACGATNLGEWPADEQRRRVASVHTCHARRCKTRVPRKLLMCAMHWRMVPAALQSAVWDAYRPGQEIGNAPVTATYLSAAKAAIDHVDHRERPPQQRMVGT